MKIARVSIDRVYASPGSIPLITSLRGRAFTSADVLLKRALSFSARVTISDRSQAAAGRIADDATFLPGTVVDHLGHETDCCRD
jgi:hypothetical protein